MPPRSSVLPRRAASLVLLAVLVTLAAGSMLASTDAAGTWSSKAPMPTARNGGMGGVIDGVLYVAGGHTGSGGTSAVDAYDASMDTWRSRAAMPSAAWNAATAVLDGKLYVIGGERGGCCVVPEVLAYDPVADTWTARAAMPIRSGCSVAGAVGGAIYVLTHCDGFNGFRTYMHRYDPASDTWTARAPAPNFHIHAASAVIDGKLYVVGGLDSNGSRATNVLDVYDPATDGWTTVAPMPTGRWQLGAAVVDGKLYVMGGGASYGGAMLATVEVYDPATNRWARETPMPMAKQGFVATTIGGRLYAVGGIRAPAVTIATVEALTLGDAVPPIVETGRAAVDDATGDGFLVPCDLADREAPCSLPPAATEGPPWMDIASASVTQIERDVVELRIVLQGPVPLTLPATEAQPPPPPPPMRPPPPAPFFAAIGIGFEGGCLPTDSGLPSGTTDKDFARIFWRDGAWRAGWGVATNCDPRSVVEGLEIRDFDIERNVVRIRVPLRELVARAGERVTWRAFAARVAFINPVFSSARPVDHAPDAGEPPTTWAEATPVATATPASTVVRPPTATPIATATVTATAAIRPGSFVAAVVYTLDTPRLGLAVFMGGNLNQLVDALTRENASAAWVQGPSGEFYLYVVGAPTFANAAFIAAFPDGFPGPKSMTLIGR